MVPTEVIKGSPAECTDAAKPVKKPAGRRRTIIVNFRVSPEEKAVIDARIYLSGLTRSDFFIQSCTQQTLTVYGNVKTFRRMQEALDQAMSRTDPSPEREEKLRMMGQIFVGLEDG